MILSDSHAFSQILKHPLGARASKPRTSGLTMMIDKGLGRIELEDILETSASYIDVLKFGFGTACLYPLHILQQKLTLANLYAVQTCTGGTLGEIAMLQNCFPEYVEYCKKYGFSCMEISDGTISISASIRRQAILTAKQHMQLVFSEVGKKIGATPNPECIIKQILDDLESGADYVIVEGRESGEGVGVYSPSGEIQDAIMNELISGLPHYARRRLLWEAPKKSQQVDLILRFGRDVNLGNIPPAEALAVESLRLGLRGDTLLADNNAK